MAYWALEPEGEILMFTWFIGPLFETGPSNVPGQVDFRHRLLLHTTGLISLVWDSAKVLSLRAGLL